MPTSSPVSKWVPEERSNGKKRKQFKNNQHSSLFLRQASIRTNSSLEYCIDAFAGISLFLLYLLRLFRFDWETVIFPFNCFLTYTIGKDEKGEERERGRNNRRKKREEARKQVETSSSYLYRYRRSSQSRSCGLSDTFPASRKKKEDKWSLQTTFTPIIGWHEVSRLKTQAYRNPNFHSGLRHITQEI